jgi:MIP family channel proteins
MQENARRLAAEFLGTFAIVFMGCGGVMIAERFPGSVAPGVVPTIFGLTVMFLIYALGHVSGAHFNPAVTVAFSASRHFPKDQIAPYVTAQTSGALAASLLLAAILPAGQSFGATVPKGITALQAVTWEFLLTFVLMLVVMGTAKDTRSVGAMAGTAIGATVAVDAFVGGPVTGASMNPARSFAPAILEGRLDVLWIYVVGPCLGALAAALLYEWMRHPARATATTAT